MFYLKYRPQLIDELDLLSVRERLSNILSSDSHPHAFLFTGPRGAGKTSAARIIAKFINCKKRSKNGEPCNSCDSCVSVKACGRESLESILESLSRTESRSSSSIN